jgi:hypothetical protein
LFSIAHALFVQYVLKEETMKRYLRQLTFLVYALLLRWPIWLLIWTVGRLGIFKTVFLIYPTDSSECLDFCPNISWLRRFFSGRPTPAGLIMNGWLPVGLYLVIPNPALELMRKKNRPLVNKITKRMLWIKKLSGAQTIGLAGQLGPIFEKRHGIPMDPPFYASTYGNIFSIQEAVRHLATTIEKMPWQVSVAVLGGGELGEQLEQHLGDDGYRLSMVGVRYTRKGNVKLADEQETDRQLEGADVVINLLPRGKDFMGCQLHERIPAHATIIDFSRPQIPAGTITQTVVMGNRVQRPGIHFFMKLPGWKRYELPACSMPALMAALSDQTASSLEEFRLTARQVAFRTALAGAPPPFLTTVKLRLRNLAGEFSIITHFCMFVLKNRLAHSVLSTMP